jgi:hypothetical protein
MPQPIGLGRRLGSNLQLGDIHSVRPEADSNGTIHPDCSWHHAQRLICKQQEGSTGSSLSRIPLQLTCNFSIFECLAEFIDYQNERQLKAALTPQKLEKCRHFIRTTSIGN